MRDGKKKHPENEAVILFVKQCYKYLLQKGSEYRLYVVKPILHRKHLDELVIILSLLHLSKTGLLILNELDLESCRYFEVQELN